VLEPHHQAGVRLLGVRLERPGLVVDVGDADFLRLAERRPGSEGERERDNRCAQLHEPPLESTAVILFRPRLRPGSASDTDIGVVSSCSSTPIQPRVTLPDFTICSSTILAVDTGMAKPMPIEPPARDEKIAVLTPTRLPVASISGPPEFPGLIAASVWIKFSK